MRLLLKTAAWVNISKQIISSLNHYANNTLNFVMTADCIHAILRKRRHLCKRCNIDFEVR